MSTAIGSNITRRVSGAPSQELSELVGLAAEANSALLRGELNRYVALIKHAADFTLMSPFGGSPTRGFDPSGEHLAELARFFESGESELELIQAYASGDLALLVLIERQHAAVGGLPDQEWSLRVTLVFRRQGSDWTLLHRHADPLARGVTLEQAAAIARGSWGDQSLGTVPR
jgi:ketosteroid isomerase-like protein